MEIIEPKFHILVARHGQTLGNVDLSAHKDFPDNVMPLTETGKLQARELGKYISAFFKQPEILAEHQKLVEQRKAQIQALNELFVEFPKLAIALPALVKMPKELPAKPHVRIIRSPFLRAEQTTDNILREASDVVTDVKENPFAYEVLFGLQDGMGNKPLDYLPQASEHYKHYSQHGGKHYVASLLGESWANVEQRCYQIIDSIHRDGSDSDIHHHVLVCHGVTSRMFIKGWMKYPTSEPSLQNNPGNGWARYLEGHRRVDRKDHGWVYTGEQAQIEKLEANISRGR